MKPKPMFKPRRYGVFEDNADLWPRVCDFEWVENFRKGLALQAEIHDLKQIRASTKNAPPPAKELLASAKKSLDEFNASRIKQIQEAVLHPRAWNCFDPIKPPVSWDDVQAAIAGLPAEPKPLSAKDKTKALDHIAQRLDTLEKDLLVVYPKSSRFRQPGADGNDLRQDLINVWRKIQKQVDSPCGPTGKALKDSSEAERAAHRDLGIDQLVNKNAKFRAYER